METDPPDDVETRAQLARVRARLTSLVERRLQFGLSAEEEAGYQRLTEVERELLRATGEAAASTPAASTPAPGTAAADPADEAGAPSS